ncbi:DUF6302 family protein [Streptomyces uncialis]|uniref:DUF6302 family protein n=1 Tax=Streptomyces uncialis TaxID=1048205 RepID=UPI0037F52AFE
MTQTVLAKPVLPDRHLPLINPFPPSGPAGSDAAPFPSTPGFPDSAFDAGWTAGAASVPGPPVELEVEVEVVYPHLAPDYGRMAECLDDPGLLSGAVAVRVPGTTLLAVPVGEERLGGALRVDRTALGGAVVRALDGLPGFPGVRVRDGGPVRGVLVEWGLSCPDEVGAVTRGRFFGIRRPAPDNPAAGSGWPAPDRRAALLDAVVLDAVARGASAGTLADRGFFPGEPEARAHVTGLGRILTGGPGTRWPGLVHLAVVQGLVPLEPCPPVTVTAEQLGLLHAWAAGASLGRHGVRARLATADVAILRQQLHRVLGARTDAHAVLRGHEAGVLGPADPGPPVRKPARARHRNAPAVFPGRTVTAACPEAPSW